MMVGGGASPQGGEVMEAEPSAALIAAAARGVCTPWQHQKNWDHGVVLPGWPIVVAITCQCKKRRYMAVVAGSEFHEMFS